ncbi:MAG TPA: peptidoglycan bridge formation glycyltransferase FemA/FemB family protein [Candidatus Paceibacterota bacterium]|nr:peptidoglycan bridge formation glycyltransferase FemA/FemB family protein [Candidatus Paceibacterota bacterium]
MPDKMISSFLQTKEWLEFQQTLGHDAWRFETGGVVANVIKHEVGFGKSYLYIPYGPVFLDNFEGFPNFISTIKRLARDVGAFFIKAEPADDQVAQILADVGFKHSGKHIQPQRTIIMDLTFSELEMLSRMYHKTRYNINLATKKGLSLREENELDVFWGLLSRTAAHDNFSTHPQEYYQKLINFFQSGKEIKTKLFFVWFQGRPIAGALTLTYGDGAYYLHGAMDRDYRHLMAPYFMHWEIMKYYKGLGLTSYDFWGIDSRNWPGLTRFKLGFGGREVEYPGSFDLPISKFWYLAYKIIRQFN